MKGFGSYGDIMIRNRKMYVAPTPYAIADGLTGTRTLVVPAEWGTPPHMQIVGRLDRREAPSIVVGYSFDLKSNVIAPTTIANPSAGKVHSFIAYRIERDSAQSVTIKADVPVVVPDDEEE